MNLGELKTSLDDLMARTDYTDSKKTQHINRALRRIQTLAQLPEMESTVGLTLDSNLSVVIPSDHFSTRDMYILESKIPCEKIHINRAKEYEDRAYTELPNPFPYYRLTTRWYYPAGVSGTNIALVYYSLADALSVDGDFNRITTSFPEAIIYGAASFACTYFKDKRVQEMEERFQTEIDEIELQRWEEEIATGSAQTVQPLHDPADYPGGW